MCLGLYTYICLGLYSDICLDIHSITVKFLNAQAPYIQSLI